MPKKNTSILEKISQSETKIKQLIDQRNNELLDILIRFKAITIDDSLFIGFLIFAMNPENKDHPMLKQFKEMASRPKTPSKPENSGSTKKTN